MTNSRIAELTEQLQNTEDKGRQEREALLDHLHGLTAESTAARLENQTLKVKPVVTVSKAEHQNLYLSVRCLCPGWCCHSNRLPLTYIRLAGGSHQLITVITDDT